jgi:molecular chaperone DnaK
MSKEAVMPKVIGIDLGTTTSCAAVIEGGAPVIIPNSKGWRTTPSIVALNEHEHFLVGEAAKQQAIPNPKNTLFSIKRLIGRKYDDPEIDRDRRLLPYKVVRANNGDAWVEVWGRQYSPQQISAIILQKLKADAEAYLGEGVIHAVITVPAYFDDAQRQATRDAGKIAGFEVLRIINEPTAASLAYGLNRKKDKRILVYDLGGGSFDVSILELGDGVFEVKSTSGDTHLGGDDFDQRIITWMVDEFRNVHHIDLRRDHMALQRLKGAAEKAKRDLSSLVQVEIDLPHIVMNASSPKHLSMILTRARLEELVADLIEKTRGPVMKAMSDAGVRAKEVDEVILVGDQTRMPAVRAYVRRLFEREPSHAVNPDEVVAIGAAIQAGVLTGDVKDVLLLDVVPFSLGIEVKGTSFTRLIERNTTIPTQKTQVFSTSQDNQSTIDIKVLQGESELSAENRLLGILTLDGIPPAPGGEPQIEVTFDIEGNGILNVSARDKGSSREQKITIFPSSGLSKIQLEHMRHDLEVLEEENRKIKEKAEEINLAESACREEEKRITELTEKLASMLKTKVANVRLALENDDTAARIREAREVMQQTFQRISEEISR